MTLKYEKRIDLTETNISNWELAGICAAAIFVSIALTSGLPNAEAHILSSCTISNTNIPSGNVVKGSDVWVAYQGTGKLAKFPQTNCSTPTTFTIGGRPEILTVSGSSRIVATDAVNNKVYVFRTDTNTLERTVTLPASPYDIYTDPSNSDTVWFTEQSTDDIAKMTASTGVVTEIDMPGTSARPKAITVGSTEVYVTDVVNKNIWKYVKSTGVWTSKFVTEGGSYGIWHETTNGQLYAPIYTANKLLAMPTSLLSYTLIAAHPEMFYDTIDCSDCNGVPPTGMFRVGNGNTDALVTYLNTGHVGAIHVFGQVDYHNADYIGGNPYNAIYGIGINGPNTFGIHATSQGSGSVPGKLVRITHFPI